MTKEQYPQHIKAVDLNNIPENFVITYFAKKHNKIITRNGSWTKPDDFMTTGRAFISKNGVVCFIYWDNDAEIIRTNSTGLTIYNPKNLADRIKGMKNQKVKTKAEKIAERLLYEQQSQVVN